MRAFVALCASFLAILVARPAAGAFHLMQIEQVIGGVDGNTGVQAIQLRMRQSTETQVQNSRLFARDATGANPILLIDVGAPVPIGAVGARILIATSNFSSFTTPPLTPDFVLTNTIPASYLAAGTLTFEDNFGTVYWRVSWGGSDYTGPGTVSTFNDNDGDANPPFPGPLPSGSGRALLLEIAPGDLGTNNADDYSITAGSATFTRNDGSSGTINSVVGVGPEATALALGSPFPNPAQGRMAYTVALPRAASVRLQVLDLAGRLVMTLWDGRLEAGRHGLEWNARQSLSSGVYQLVMESEGQRRSRRFALLR
jgi:hypothetical protein